MFFKKTLTRWNIFFLKIEIFPRILKFLQNAEKKVFWKKRPVSKYLHFVFVYIFCRSHGKFYVWILPKINKTDFYLIVDGRFFDHNVVSTKISSFAKGINTRFNISVMESNLAQAIQCVQKLFPNIWRAPHGQAFDFSSPQ